MDKHHFRNWLALTLLLACCAVVTGCGSDPKPDLTREEYDVMIAFGGWKDGESYATIRLYQAIPDNPDAKTKLVGVQGATLTFTERFANESFVWKERTNLMWGTVGVQPKHKKLDSLSVELVVTAGSKELRGSASGPGLPTLLDVVAASGQTK